MALIPIHAAAAALVLTGAFLFGCSEPQPTPTPTPTPPSEDELFAEADRFALEFAVEPTPPAPTPTRVALVIPTPEVSPESMAQLGDATLPEPLYGRTASADRGGDGPNLVPHIPEGSSGPIRASGTDGPLRSDGESRIGLSVANVGRGAARGQFFVDLYFDDLVVQRFPVRRALGAGGTVSWEDFGQLARLVRVEPGEHTLRIVVDSTNLIAEADETDNVAEIKLIWDGPPSAPLVEGADSGVNLTFYSPPEWGVPLVAGSEPAEVLLERGPYEPVRAATSEHSRPLSAATDTFVSYGIANEGHLSHPGGMLVDMYLDDTLVLRDRWMNLIARQQVHRRPWGALGDVIKLTPGRHTLRLVIDPNDLVAETDETDNIYERELEWSSDPVEIPPVEPAELPLPQAPAVLTLPNLVPGWLWEWDGPMVIDSAPGTNIDGVMLAGGEVYLDLVVFNRSPVPADSGFAVDLYLDDVQLHGFELSGLTPARSFRVIQDWAGLNGRGLLSPGPHVLRMVVDPDDRVREADESDNVFEKHFTVAAAAPTTPERTTYTEGELREALAGLGEALWSSEPVLTDDGVGDAADVIGAADAGLYVLTGTSFRDQRISVKVLPRPQYLAWIDESYDELFAVDDGANHEFLARGLAWDKAVSLAKKQRHLGTIEVVVDGGHPFGVVLSSLVHELAHAMQDLLNPAQTEAGDFIELAAIREAQAQQMERAYWLAVEEFTGERFTLYPDYSGYRAFVDVSLRADVSSLQRSEHALGRMIQWLAVLADPNLVELGNEVVETGGLGPESSLALYMYLVAMDPAAAGDYVSGLMPALGPALRTIAALSLGRLGELDSPRDEGSPYLRHAALLAP